MLGGSAGDKLNELFYTILTIIFFFAVLLMMFDCNNFSGIDCEEDQNWFLAFFNRVYFCSTTLSTCGYGDIYPKTVMTRSICVIFHITILMNIVGILMSS
jgi:hypothetical protein